MPTSEKLKGVSWLIRLSTWWKPKSAWFTRCDVKIYVCASERFLKRVGWLEGDPGTVSPVKWVCGSVMFCSLLAKKKRPSNLLLSDWR